MGLCVPSLNKGYLSLHIYLTYLTMLSFLFFEFFFLKINLFIYLFFELINNVDLFCI